MMIVTTRMSPNKRFKEQNNSSACDTEIFVHFFAVRLCKTRTSNDQVLHSLRNANDDSSFFIFHLELKGDIAYLALACC